MRQQLPVCDYPSETITLTCDACGRKGRYRKATLVQRYGPNAGLVNILNDLAKDCPQAVRDVQGISRCGARYGEL